METKDEDIIRIVHSWMLRITLVSVTFFICSGFVNYKQQKTSHNSKAIKNHTVYLLNQLIKNK